MAKMITDISKDNFPTAVKYACSLNRKMTANIHAQNLVLPLGSMLFALHAFILLLGVAHAIATEKGGSVPFLDTFPIFPQYCTNLWLLFGRITDQVFLRVIMFFALLYLVPIVVCGIVRLALSIYIKGETPTLEGTVPKQAKQLYRYVEQGPFHTKDPQDAQIIWCRICGIPVILGFTAVVAHALYGGLAVNNHSFWLHIAFFAIVILEAALCYILYARLYFLLIVFIRPYYNSRKTWETFKSEVDRYWLSVDPEEKRNRKKASNESYDGWKYRNLGTSSYSKEKFKEYYANYMGYPYESDADRAKKLVREVEEDMSGGGWGDY